MDQGYQRHFKSGHGLRPALLAGNQQGQSTTEQFLVSLSLLITFFHFKSLLSLQAYFHSNPASGPFDLSSIKA